MTAASFSVATTIFISLAICAVVSYGIFYYFKQRISVIEKSQMEQARIMQSLISHGLAQREHQILSQPEHPQQDHHYDKEITITQSELIEVSSDSETESDSESGSESESESESGSEFESESVSKDKWSVGDEIHQPDSYHAESFKKNVLLDAVCIDSSSYDVIDIANADTSSELQQKKIISLNKGALVTEDDDKSDHDGDDNDDNDDNDDDSSTSSDGNDGTNDNELKGDDFELKIGYKSSSDSSAKHLNYGNMSVSALRQLAKERGLDNGDLQKLKKKELVQLLNHE